MRNRFRRRVRMAFLGCAEGLLEHPWIVWVRPGRAARPLDQICLQDIENELRQALCRLPAPDMP